MKSQIKIFSKFIIILLLTSGRIFSQEIPADVFQIDSLPDDGVLLDKGWKYHPGDNWEWSKAGFDDKLWGSIDPTKEISDISELWKTNIGWFRLRFNIDSSLAHQSISLHVEQTGASEFYLNGQLIGRFGKISDQTGSIQAAAPSDLSFIGIPITKPGEQVLAVRFAIQKNLHYIIFGLSNSTLSLTALETQKIEGFLQRNYRGVYFEFLRFGLLFILCILHLSLFCFNPSQKANLYFFFYALLSSVFALFAGLTRNFVDLASIKSAFIIISDLCYYSGFLFFLTAVYEVFNQKRRLIYWTLLAIFLLCVIWPFTDYHYPQLFGIIVFSVLILLESTRITFIALKAKQRGANIVAAGAIAYILLYPLAWVFRGIYADLAWNLGYLSMPIAISIYLALESSFASRSLKVKLIEVEQLSQRTLEQETERKQILATQNERLEQQVQDRTAALKQSLEDLKSTQSQLIQSEKMASLGELTAGIAHEIQNPLNFVNNFSEVNTELIDEAKHAIDFGNSVEAKQLLSSLRDNEEKIKFHGQRADAIVKGMLQHSRASTGQKEPTDINALADEYLRLSYHGLRAKDKSFNAKIQTDFDPTIGNINIVVQDLGRVLLNLYNNAFYATMEKKKKRLEGYEPAVSVITKMIEKIVEIRVIDNGIGIPQKVIDKIFQPFFTTKPAGQGTGLGLSISYDIIKAHGGEIKVETEEGKGTEFIIILPISP
jgi:two-component system, NtrC family, sensor kinase